MSLVSASHLEKTYRSGDVSVSAIKGADFSIEPSSFVAFVGPSGSGKTTLLNMIGCLDHPSGGQLTVAGTDIATLSRKTAAKFRAERIGNSTPPPEILPSGMQHVKTRISPGILARPSRTIA